MLQRCELVTISRQARESSCHACKASATLQAWAMHPFGVKGQIAVENLGDRADSVVGDVIGRRRHERGRRRGVAVNLEMGERERAEEPRLRRALVIGSVARSLVAPIVASVVEMSGREGPQPERRQEIPGTGVDDARLALAIAGRLSRSV
jgi:hypothetical protein